MKTKNLKFFYLIFLFAFLPALAFFSAYVSPQQNASAETNVVTSIEDISDKNGFFTFHSTAVPRSGETIYGRTETVMTENGEITYYCFNWRDISSITFSFSANLTNSKNIFTNYEFLVTSIQTENLQTSLGQAKPEDTRTLLRGTISSNTPTFSNIYYFFDSDAITTDSEFKFSGNDFGLYKFDFNYTFIENTEEGTKSHTQHLGKELYIAILPDNIDAISVGNLSLTYSVASSKELMNIYNITFSNQDTLKYVNPEYIKWTVTGKDKKNVSYVLTKQIQQNGFPSCKYIWEALKPEQQQGTSFVLDTNNIEGNWNVHCTIYNSDFSEKTSLTTGRLTTIKHKEKSYVWLILGIVFGVIILITIIILLVYWKKNKKKS